MFFGLNKSVKFIRLMICFDRLKLKCNREYIDSIDLNLFNTIQIESKVIKYEFRQNKPYFLDILIDEVNGILMIEFTSKILLDDCVELINYNTIRQCLTNINKLGLCNLAIDDILKDAEVLKLDVTLDIECNNLNSLKQQIRSSLSNYNKWIDIKYPNNGLKIQNTVSTLNCQKRLVVYDKSKELAGCKNQFFMGALENKQNVQEFYANKVRFEINIKTMKQIRDLLQIFDNNLCSVLYSDASPILEIFDEAIQLQKIDNDDKNYEDYEKLTFADFDNITDFRNYLILKEFDFDLKRISASLKNLYSENTQWTKILKPYRELLLRLKPSDNWLKQIREKLM